MLLLHSNIVLHTSLDSHLEPLISYHALPIDTSYILLYYIHPYGPCILNLGTRQNTE
nr:MAG TPA: hypothetical protein [Caudoviricetes sp.]